MNQVVGELCPVDVLEAGHFLEGTHLHDADQVFDLTIGELYAAMQDAMKEAA